jgi:hypothetical protein
VRDRRIGSLNVHMYLPTRLRLGRAPLGLLQIIHVDSRGRLIPVPITSKLFILSTIVLAVLTPTRPRSLATMHGVHVTAVQEVTGCFARGINNRLNTLLLCIIYNGECSTASYAQCSIDHRRDVVGR